MSYYNRGPKREPNFDNHSYRGLNTENRVLGDIIIILQQIGFRVGGGGECGFRAWRLGIPKGFL